jgi:flavin reductase (DIM6/NTAB) family NADH-FMN oxidoreductase RutF
VPGQDRLRRLQAWGSSHVNYGMMGCMAQKQAPNEQPMSDFSKGFDYPVYVVTAADAAGGKSGCLVGFATQCSLKPARFLVCISQQNHTHQVALEAGVLAVHVLERGQRELAELFGEATGDQTDKFSRCGWVPGPEDVPLLSDAARVMVGRVEERVELGDHTGFVLSPMETHGDKITELLVFSDVKDLDAGHPA